MDRCHECGFVYDDLPRDEIATALVTVADQYPPRLTWTDGDTLRRRPTADTWSPLEYACHVRDLLTAQRERCSLALAFRDPLFESMPDVRVELRHNHQDARMVASGIVHAADTLGALFDTLSPREWERTGRVPLPGAPASRDLAWLGRHTVHELVHHLGDVTRSIQPTPGSVSG